MGEGSQGVLRKGGWQYCTRAEQTLFLLGLMNQTPACHHRAPSNLSSKILLPFSPQFRLSELWRRKAARFLRGFQPLPSFAFLFFYTTIEVIIAFSQHRTQISAASTAIIQTAVKQMIRFCAYYATCQSFHISTCSLSFTMALSPAHLPISWQSSSGAAVSCLVGALQSSDCASGLQQVPRQGT